MAEYRSGVPIPSASEAHPQQRSGSKPRKKGRRAGGDGMKDDKTPMSPVVQAGSYSTNQLYGFNRDNAMSPNSMASASSYGDRSGSERPMSPKSKYQAQQIMSLKEKRRLHGSFDHFINNVDQYIERAERDPDLVEPRKQLSNRSSKGGGETNVAEDLPEHSRQTGVRNNTAKRGSNGIHEGEKDSGDSGRSRGPLPIPTTMQLVPGALMTSPGGAMRQLSRASSINSIGSGPQREQDLESIPDDPQGRKHRSYKLSAIEENQSRHRMILLVILGVLLAALVGVGGTMAFLILSASSEDSETTNDAPPVCAIAEAELFNCFQSPVFVPACADEAYQELARDFLPFLHPNYRSVLVSTATNRCDPARLALIQTAVAMTRNPSLRLREYYLLAVLFLATDGLAWSRRLGWLSYETEPCSWVGISCSGNGSGPPTVLTHIDIARNDLEGTLPTELGLMTTLEVLRFDENFISGKIPTELVNIPGLGELRLSSNPFNGKIPPEIGLLRQLEVLHLDRTRITGTIPASIGQATSLRELRLEGTSRLSGTIVSEIGLLTRLEELVITSTHFSPGAVPKSFQRLSMLKTLNLNATSLAGQFPLDLSALGDSLEELRLDDNSLGGTLPPEIGLFTRLRTLSLQGNTFAGSVPSELGLCTSLTTLNLAENRFGGELPSELGLLNAVTAVSLQGNILSGTVPSEICAWGDRSVTITADFCPLEQRTCIDGDCLM